MKLKALALILVAAMILPLLAGCGSILPGKNLPSEVSPPLGGEPSSSPAESAPATEPPEEAPEDVPEPSPDHSSLRVDLSAIAGISREPVVWGPGVRRNAAGRSEACDMLQQAYGHYDAMFIGPDDKNVYLTFDQGYENGFTEAILDTLKEKDVKAVFFLTGHYITSAPELVQRMIDEGHVLGNHSYHHPNYATATAEAAFEDLNKLHEAVYDEWGIAMDLFRFPEGAFSEQSLALIQSTGYTTLFWSFAYNDWNPDSQMEPAAALEKAVAGAHNGSIYLFHTVGRTNSIILGDLIDALRDEGYSFALPAPMHPAGE